MPRRRSMLAAQLGRLERLREEQPADLCEQLAALLESEAHFIASEAAKLAQELSLTELGPVLAKTFSRVHDGLQPDRGCAVAQAAIAAMGSFEMPARGTYLQASFTSTRCQRPRPRRSPTWLGAPPRAFARR